MTDTIDVAALVERYIARATELSEGGKLTWWTGLADLLQSQADALAEARREKEEAAALAANDEMRKISALIADLQSTLDRFGDTCVYIRRGGLSWGAVALNWRADDKEHGVFDLQAKHDRDMIARLEQIERLIADRNEQRARATTAEASLATMREALEAHEKLLLVNKVRHVAEEVAPLWLQNADRLTARALGGSNAE